MTRCKIFALGATVLAFAASISMTGATEIPARVPQSLVEATDRLEAVRKAGRDDGAALQAALQHVDTALAEFIAGGATPKVVRRRSGAPSTVPTERAYPDLPPTPDTMYKATRRTHITPPLPGDPSPTKPRDMTSEQAAEARALVARLRRLIEKDAAGKDVEARLNELSALLAR